MEKFTESTKKSLVNPVSNTGEAGSFLESVGPVSNNYAEGVLRKVRCFMVFAVEDRGGLPQWDVFPGRLMK